MPDQRLDRHAMAMRQPDQFRPGSAIMGSRLPTSANIIGPRSNGCNNVGKGGCRRVFVSSISDRSRRGV